MNRKILTVQDLYSYLVNQNANLRFDSNSADFEIAVSSPGCFEVEEYKDDEGLIYGDVKAFHDLSNRNRSFIDPEVFAQRISTMENRPIMADIVDCEDENGNKVRDFSGHTMHFDEKSEKMIYTEIPVGHVINPENIRVEYDEDHQRDYALADCVIYEEYTDACEILKRRQKVDCSVELVIRNMSFDAATKELKLDDYYVQGITLLGEKYQPGMEGSNVTLKDFSVENNSVYFDRDSLINEVTTAVLNRLSDKMAGFSAEKTTERRETPMNDFENEEVNVTSEGEVTDPDVDAGNSVNGSNPEDPGVEFVDDDPEDPTEGSTEDITEDEPADDTTEAVDDTAVTDEAEHTTDDDDQVRNNFQKVFEVSHEDIRSGLYALLSAYEEADGEWYWITKTWDDHFIYEGCCENHVYDQKYSVENNVISFVGDRVHMNCEYLTDGELAALNEMRANYSSIQEQLSQYQARELHAQREELLAAEDYAVMNDYADFTELKKNMDNYSLEDLSKEADLCYAKFMKANRSTFTAHTQPKKKNDFFAFAKVEPKMDYLDGLLGRK